MQEHKQIAIARCQTDDSFAAVFSENVHELTLTYLSKFVVYLFMLVYVWLF